MKEQPFERILVVDDEELMREMTLALVLMMGYSCDAVSSGEEAMERLQREHFDMVVSDITMKGMNGLEFMEKAKERFPQLGFIIMTAYTSEYSYSDIIKAGAIDYLAKPFEQAELEARLQRATRERRLFRQLKESEKRYRALFQGAAQGILVADIETKELKYANSAICAMLGYTKEELEGMSVGDIHPKEALERVISEFQAQARAEKTLAPCIPCLRRDGTTVYADINTTRVFLGGTECNVGFFTDITERKRREEALQKSHDELQKTLRQLKMTQGRMLQSEKMASIGQLAAGVAHEINNPAAFVSSNLTTLSDYQHDISTLIEQYRRLAADLKATRPTAEYPVPISEQLQRIAELEAEVDIDFVLSDTLDLVKESREGTERIKKIVLDLKDFAHPGEDKPKLADINQGLESTLNIVWNELKYKAKVIKEYGEVPQVKCYPQQLNQVFMNLLVNAAQAIEKEGEIKITTRALDGKVQIKISDTGAGIPEENLSRIFDPFLTTKEVGKGTGLGLNMAYNIIQKHKGTIDVESEMGRGTTFVISIPLNTNDQ